MDEPVSTRSPETWARDGAYGETARGGRGDRLVKQVRQYFLVCWRRLQENLLAPPPSNS